MTAPELASSSSVGTEFLGQAIGVAAKSIADNANALGLTWQLRLGTVVTSSVTEQITVRLDGDTEPIGMISMIGTLPTNLRVYVITIPPSGNYVVGFASSYTTKPCYGIGKQTGTLGTTGVEAAIAAASWVEEPNVIIGPQQIVKVTLTICLFPSTATNSIAIVRIRKGSVSTTGTQLCFWHYQMVTQASTNAVDQTLVGYFKNTTASEFSGKLSVTLLALGGAANVSVFSDANHILVCEVSPHSMIGVDSSFDARLVSIA